MAFSIMFIPEVIFQIPSAVTLAGTLAGTLRRIERQRGRQRHRKDRRSAGKELIVASTCASTRQPDGGSPGLAMNDMERKEPLIWNLYNYIDYNYITITHSLIYVVPT